MKKVYNSEKNKFVYRIFSEVSKKYDFMNDFMSLGFHRIWKKKLVFRVKNVDSYILDVATGTGDIIIYLKDLSQRMGKTPIITACDINPDMLEICRERLFDKNITNFSSHIADAENLPFEDNSFDYYLVSFGIRNVSSVKKLMNEAYRVLKPMGKILSLEFVRPPLDSLFFFKDFYLSNIIPKMGKIFADNEEAYRYLGDSIKSFYSSEELKSFMVEAGFLNVGFEEMPLSVASIHFGVKI